MRPIVDNKNNKNVTNKIRYKHSQVRLQPIKKVKSCHSIKINIFVCIKVSSKVR